MMNDGHGRRMTNDAETLHERSREAYLCIDMPWARDTIGKRDMRLDKRDRRYLDLAVVGFISNAGTLRVWMCTERDGDEQ